MGSLSTGLARRRWLAADPRFQAVSFTGGTDGSNPAPSRRESAANLTPADAERPGRSFCREGRERGASYPREPARSPDTPGSAPQKGTVPILVQGDEGPAQVIQLGASGHSVILKRWPAFTRFLDDGQICLTNNAAERAPRGGWKTTAVSDRRPR